MWEPRRGIRPTPSNTISYIPHQPCGVRWPCILCHSFPRGHPVPSSRFSSVRCVDPNYSGLWLIFITSLLSCLNSVFFICRLAKPSLVWFMVELYYICRIEGECLNRWYIQRGFVPYERWVNGTSFIFKLSSFILSFDLWRRLRTFLLAHDIVKQSDVYMWPPTASCLLIRPLYQSVIHTWSRLLICEGRPEVLLLVWSAWKIYLESEEEENPVHASPNMSNESIIHNTADPPENCQRILNSRSVKLQVELSQNYRQTVFYN